MEDYTTGTGQKIKVHDKKDCKGRHCCIHNPSDHHMKDWPTHWREDRQLMERICSCGVGHPDPDDLAYKESLGLDIKTISIHGCCGHCRKEEKMKFYRYKDIRYADRVRIHLIEYDLVKETPKGYWIKYDWDRDDDHKRWVSKDGKSRYAYPTKEEAMVNFLARKKRQIEILEYKLRDARMALFYGEQM